ncbi:MAG: sigma 54-interacting transcriptional regulator [Planctomycetota bacterium]
MPTTRTPSAEILIVDDKAENRALLEAHVSASGHHATMAENGREALDAMAARLPDLVLLDIMMPVMDGFETLETMRRDDRLSKIPVIILSADGDTDSIVRGISLGADDYIAKPFKTEVLAARVASSLQKKFLRDREADYVNRIESYNSRLSALFDSVNDGLILVDDERMIRAMNRQAGALLDINPVEAIGHPITYIADFAATSGRFPFIDSATGSIKLMSREQTLLATRSGRELQIIATVSPLRRDNGEAGFVIAFHDVSELLKLRMDVRSRFNYHGIIGMSAAMRDLIQMLERMAPTKATVLISGETGTGKELFASAVHYASARSNGPLVKVNVAALPESLLESELFGHIKGSFTGADRTRVGRFELADGGTIFLDEIGEIPPNVQVKLLRVLQDQMIEKIGEAHSKKIDVRIVAATNKDLRESIDAGLFREDLYYRLNTIHLRVPPLRERREDIIPLSEKFLSELATRESRSEKKLHADCLPVLLEADWPGNVRQLEHVIEYAWYHSTQDYIHASDLPQETWERIRRSEPSARRTGSRRESTSSSSGRTNDMRPVSEAEYLREVLVRNDGKLGPTAEELGMHRTTLWRKLKRYGLQ